MCKKNSEGATACLFLLPLQACVEIKGERREVASFCVIARILMMGTPGKVIKVQLKTNNFLNSTMMASFLPVIIVSKKQTKKNMSFIAVYHKFT